MREPGRASTAVSNSSSISATYIRCESLSAIPGRLDRIDVLEAHSERVVVPGSDGRPLRSKVITFRLTFAQRPSQSAVLVRVRAHALRSNGRWAWMLPLSASRCISQVSAAPRLRICTRTSECGLVSTSSTTRCRQTGPWPRALHRGRRGDEGQDRSQTADRGARAGGGRAELATPMSWRARTAGRVDCALRHPRPVADRVPSHRSHEDDRPLAQNHVPTIRLNPAIAVSESTETDLFAVDPQLPRQASPRTLDLLLRGIDPVSDEKASQGR